MPSRNVKARSESLRAGISTMIAAKRQSELTFKPSVQACFAQARESRASEKDFNCRDATKEREFAPLPWRGQGLAGSAPVRLGFFWIGDYDADATMVSEPARPAPMAAQPSRRTG
jgi:hypothetical protein